MTTLKFRPIRDSPFWVWSVWFVIDKHLVVGQIWKSYYFHNFYFFINAVNELVPNKPQFP